MDEVERERYKQLPVQQWQLHQQQQNGVHEFTGAHRPVEMRMSKVYAVCCYINSFCLLFQIG